MFRVDGRVSERDLAIRPDFIKSAPDSLNTDEAWVLAREVLARPDFLEALRQFRAVSPQGDVGFSGASLVLDDSNLPVVGEIMYIRESVHCLSQEAAMAPVQENSSYELTTLEVQQAGKDQDSGADRDNYEERIGLAYYLMDINAYEAKDLLYDGAYSWPVTGNLRPDLQEQGGQPVNPVYLPYRILVAPGVKPAGNRLCCKFFFSGWAELRVLAIWQF